MRRLTLGQDGNQFDSIYRFLNETSCDVLTPAKAEFLRADTTDGEVCHSIASPANIICQFKSKIERSVNLNGLQMIKINILSECEFIFRAYLKRFKRFGGKRICAKDLWPSIGAIDLHPGYWMFHQFCTQKNSRLAFEALRKFETHQEEGEVDRMLCHLSLLESFDS